MEDILPEKIEGDGRFGERFTHPAFGVITMSHPVGGKPCSLGRMCHIPAQYQSRSKLRN